jgi:hypothetical protein
VVGLYMVSNNNCLWASFTPDGSEFMVRFTGRVTKNISL